MHAKPTAALTALLGIALCFALTNVGRIGGTAAWAQESPSPAVSNATDEDAPPGAEDASAQPEPSSGAPPSADGEQKEVPDEVKAESPAAEPSSAALPINGPRDWLRGHDVDDSHFERLLDGCPVDGGDTEVLLDVMYWLGRLQQTLLDQWTHEDWDIARLKEKTNENRGEIFLLTGRVTSLEVVEPVPEIVDRLELPEYYRCRFVLPNDQPAEIFARDLPKTWLAAIQDKDSGPGIPPDGYRASVRGLFLKLAGEDAEHPTPVFVAPRIAWHPDTPLGNLGMDVGLLEAVEDRRPLTGNDRECFYQMLAAAGRTPPGEILRQAQAELERSGEEHYSVVPLFNESESQRGRIVSLHGTTRRLVKIEVSDADIIERFGIDHYYEMALYTDDSRGNPLWFCLLELPEGMPTGDGPRYGEEVRVAGFFMKTWAYRSQEVEPEKDAGESPRQRVRLAPLLVGRCPVWYPRQPASENTFMAAIAGGLFVLALVGVWIGLWYYSRSDREFHQRTIAKTHSLDSGISLDEIALNADGKPDFSGLSEAESDREDGQP